MWTLPDIDIAQVSQAFSRDWRLSVSHILLNYLLIFVCLFGWFVQIEEYSDIYAFIARNLNLQWQD